MLLKLRETKANLLKMTDNQLDTTTKRTIAENEQAGRLRLPPPLARAIALTAPRRTTGRTHRRTNPLSPPRNRTALTTSPPPPKPQMSSELAWQSKETEKLIRKNDKLIGENQSLRRELALHKQTQEEFAKKVHVYQKTIKTLLAKLNALDANQQSELQKLKFDEEEKCGPPSAERPRPRAHIGPCRHHTADPGHSPD